MSVSYATFGENLRSACGKMPGFRVCCHEAHGKDNPPEAIGSSGNSPNISGERTFPGKGCRNKTKRGPLGPFDTSDMWWESALLFFQDDDVFAVHRVHVGAFLVRGARDARHPFAGDRPDVGMLVPEAVLLEHLGRKMIQRDLYSFDGTVSDDIADPAAAAHDARYVGDGAVVVVQKGHDLHISAPVDLLDLLELAGDRFRAEGKFRLELAAH